MPSSIWTFRSSGLYSLRKGLYNDYLDGTCPQLCSKSCGFFPVSLSIFNPRRSRSRLLGIDICKCQVPSVIGKCVSLSMVEVVLASFARYALHIHMYDYKGAIQFRFHFQCTDVWLFRDYPMFVGVFPSFTFRGRSRVVLGSFARYALHIHLSGFMKTWLQWVSKGPWYQDFDPPHPGQWVTVRTFHWALQLSR